MDVRVLNQTRVNLHTSRGAGDVRPTYDSATACVAVNVLDPYHQTLTGRLDREVLDQSVLRVADGNTEGFAALSGLDVPDGDVVGVDVDVTGHLVALEDRSCFLNDDG